VVYDLDLNPFMVFLPNTDFNVGPTLQGLYKFIFTYRIINECKVAQISLTICLMIPKHT